MSVRDVNTDGVRLRFPVARRLRGFTLIELMVALLLGLIVIGGVASVFLANQQTYRTNNALGDVQDSSRLAFEMLAHDIRNAQLTGCNNNVRFTNVLLNGPANGGTAWWANWGNAIVGYGPGVDDPAVTSGTAMTNRVGTTDSIELLGAADTAMSVNLHSPSAATPNFTINGSAGDLRSGDVIIVCDPDHATILKTTKYTDATKTITYDATNNCSTGLGYPGVCVASGNPYTFGQSALVSKLSAVDWYIGVNPNPNGGQSLYRVSLVNTAGVLSTTAQEMVRNVTAMTITYLQSGTTSFVPAASVTNWAGVTAAQVQLTLQSDDARAGTNGQALTRTFSTTATLRNRVN
jgi:type IV pilus assembly protein PilW